MDHEYPFLSRAFIELNPENEQRIHGIIHFEERSTIEQYCSSAGFENILTSYDTDSSALVFERSESFLKWLWSTTHRVWKGILGIRDLTKIRCGIRENAKYLDGIRDLTTTREAGFAKIWARDAGFFACLSRIREIVTTQINVLAAKIFRVRKQTKL